MTKVSRIVRLACAATAIALATAVPASAGHDEVQDDPAVVAERLHRMGFVEWRKLSWDRHGFWKIDDARRQNGHVYDLTLEAGSFDLVRLNRERG
ncbi:hypothetical protein [Hyphomicrobium sp.]|jgi:hypothetical protein|uniref:hypothetical protein n=1 Tax=Hyphomicrobium sp. TaxID=82 RepID=UPI003569AF85